jgi:integrase
MIKLEGLARSNLWGLPCSNDIFLIPFIYSPSMFKKPKLYYVLSHTLPTGERFPVLINNETGIPPVLSLRYSLSRRSRGGAARLTSLLRGLSDLYEWCEKVPKVNLDELITSGRLISLHWLERALTDLDIINNMKGPKEGLDGQLGPTGNGSARAHNRRIRAWEDFLLWALYPKNYQSCYQPESDPEGKKDRRERRVELELFFSNARKPEPASVHHSGLSSEELEAIMVAIGPDEQGSFPESGFSENTRRRNWTMYSVGRWGGLRRGEILKLKTCDVPRRVKDEFTGQMVYTSHEIQVVRRPDDPDDPRTSRTPSVKRHSRAVVLPETLLDDLNAYIDERGVAGFKASYLFTSETGSPLSIERADNIIKQIGRYAASVFEERHPGVQHSLHELSWHRLRYTRAKELLPEFLEAGPIGLDEFLEYFGWVSLESAAPYVKEFHRERATARIRDINTRLTNDSLAVKGKKTTRE